MSSIRALAADLASRSDAALRELFTARPDVADPPVPDFSALAARAATRVSVQRALENLTTPQTRVLEAIHLLADADTGAGTTAVQLVPAIGGAASDTIAEIVEELHRLALLHLAEPPAEPVGEPPTEPVTEPGPTPAADPAAPDTRGTYLPVSSLKDVIGPYPLGLGRSYQALAAASPAFGERVVNLVCELRGRGYPVEPAAGAEEAAAALDRWVSDPACWAELISQAPPGTGELLGRLRTTAVGSAAHAGAQVSVLEEEEEVTPVPWLLARGLLVPLDAGHVELPRSVGRAARGHRLVEDLQLQPPGADLTGISSARRDNAAFGGVAETLRLLTELLDEAEMKPLATLRAGGIGVREVRRVSERLQIDNSRSAMTLELAALAGLLVLSPDTSQWTASREAADWLVGPRADQWVVLVQGWLRGPRAPSLVGEPLPAGTSINPLAAEASRPDAPLVRRRTLEVLVELDTEAAARRQSEETGGQANSAAAVLDSGSVITRLTWHQPRLQRRFRRLVPGILAEAELLGLTGSGALTDVGAAVGRGETAEAARRLDASLPAPLDYVLLQADLTAVAPGYLEPALARELRLLAAAEGQGPATIYRFSASSIRRALDAGRDGPQILRFLAKHSRTELPQPLTYLIEDTAARHGTLRMGAAGSYVRSEDEAALAMLLADSRAEALGLRQIAPTVVISRATARELTVVLQELGLSALMEHDDGTGRLGDLSDSVGSPPKDRSAGQRGAGHAFAPGGTPGNGSRGDGSDGEISAADVDISAQIERLRSADPVRAATAGESGPLISMETLQQAIRTKRPVRLGIVDSAGNHQHELLVPLSVAGGRVRAYDPRHEVERVVSIHRVMDVELLPQSEAP